MADLREEFKTLKDRIEGTLSKATDTLQEQVVKRHLWRSLAEFRLKYQDGTGYVTRGELEYQNTCEVHLWIIIFVSLMRGIDFETVQTVCSHAQLVN